MDAACSAYLDSLTGAMRGLPGVRGVWLSGSAAMGDDAPSRSDLDVIVSVAEPPPESETAALIGRIRHETLPCPRAGLDLSVFLAVILADPPREVPYVLAVTTGSKWPLDVSRDGRDAGSILDLAVCRRSGRALAGPEPRDAIGEVPRKWIEEAARGAVAWHRRFVHHGFHDPLGDQAVLNACRAWMLHEEGMICSKSDAARWARGDWRDRGIIGEALDARAGLRNAPLERGAVIAFLDEVLRRIGDR